MTNVITAENISKLYHIGVGQSNGASLRESLDALLKNPVGWLTKKRHGTSQELWALKDVNFSIEEGEVVGLIGHNGAGKSTLLKILSRITAPTSGQIQVRGSMASLLEVGTGFHPELTGRENIFLNGAILGMSRSEMKRKFDEIVAFSEIDKFINMPVKYYSSGMYMRLAFAVAAHIDPDILVVDEVLAVGDMSFQQKCMSKIRETTAKGHTVLMVSHNMSAVSRLCKKTIWIDHGRIKFFGPTPEAIDSYAQTLPAVSGEYVRGEIPIAQQLCVTAGRLRGADGKVRSRLDAGADFTVEVDYKVNRPTLAWVGFLVSTTDGFHVLSATDGDNDCYAMTSRESGTYTSVCTLPGGLFNAGRYLLTFYAARTASGKVEIFDFLEGVLSFEVDNPAGIGSYMPRSRYGVISPRLEWEIRNPEMEAARAMHAVVDEDAHTGLPVSS